MFESNEEAANDDPIQLVSFNLGSEEFGIDILKVQEIIRMVEVTKVPQALHYVEGVINLRGKVIPVIDLRTRFGLKTKDRDKNSRIMVCDVKGHIIGMVVDAVSEVLRIPSSTVEPPPAIATGVHHHYINGVVKLEERLLLFLDVSRLATDAAGELEVADSVPSSNT